MHAANRLVSHTAAIFGRSFCPLFAITIIAGTMLWGPWATLAITVLTICAALRYL
jgi:hypothetical protein